MTLQIQRVIYKRVLPGDQLKFRNKSNSTLTGGGARDLRFRPWDKYKPVIVQMFPKQKTRATSRTVNGKRVPVQAIYHEGVLRYDAGGKPQEMKLEFWEPTTARPNEARLSKVSSIPLFKPGGIKGNLGAVFMLLVQMSDGKLGAAWTYEQYLRNNPGWNPKVRDPLVNALDAASATTNLHGWIDLVAGKSEHISHG